MERYPEYSNKTILYKQKIKGKTSLPKYIIKESITPKPNRGLLFNDNKFYLKAYFLGRREKYFIFKPYNKAKYENKIVQAEKKFTKKIARKPQDSLRIERLAEKRDRKIVKQNNILNKGNWLMRSIGEEPALYDSNSVEKNRASLEATFKANGFFHAKIESDYTQKGIKSKVVFSIVEGEPHLVSAIKYDIKDKTIETIINNATKDSHLKEKSRFSVEKISLERERINKLLKDNGYFKFHRQYIAFEIDTLDKKNELEITILIENPKDYPHVQYTVDSIVFAIDGSKMSQKDTIIYEGVVFIHAKGKYSKKILRKDIRYQKGDKYSLTKTQLTQSHLGTKDIFKFINLSYQPIDSNKLRLYIETSSLKKFQATTEMGANVNISQGQGLPGPFIRFSFKDRKVFNGFEILEINTRYSYEQQPLIIQNQKNLRAIEAGGNVNLIFPQFVFPGRFKKIFEDFYPKTIFSVGYTYTERVEYTRNNLELTLNYKWNPNRFSTYTLSPLNLSIVNTKNISTPFQNYLDQLSTRGNNLKYSFQPALIPTFNGSYIYNDNDLTKNKKGKYFRLFGETGGLISSLFMKSQEVVSNQANERLFGLPIYQFVKVNFDQRKYMPVSSTGTLVLRLNVGVASPVGGSKVLPYDRYFFVGGLNSIRAWPLKRLGPGEYVYSDQNGKPSYNFEQPGEVIIESNLEIRTKLIGFIHGAVFLDAGNVWTLKPDPARPGSEFKLDKFSRQVALGTGAGLRFNFSFLVVRFDLGIKLWDPARKIIVPMNDKQKYVFNFGIGYPF